jgi:hypothetical protein
MPRRYKLNFDLIPIPLWKHNLRSSIHGLGPQRCRGNPLQKREYFMLRSLIAAARAFAVVSRCVRVFRTSNSLPSTQQ